MRHRMRLSIGTVSQGSLCETPGGKVGLQASRRSKMRQMSRLSSMPIAVEPQCREFTLEMREVVTLVPAKCIHSAIQLFAPRLYLDDRGGKE